MEQQELFNDSSEFGFRPVGASTPEGVRIPARRGLHPGGSSETNHEPEIHVPPKYIETALHREELVKLFLQAVQLHPDQSRSGTIDEFLQIYNKAEISPYLRSQLGPISRSTLYGWLQGYAESGIEGLIPKYTGGLQKLTKGEKYWLTRTLKDKIRIGTAIVIVKYILGMKKNESPSSKATLRRWGKKFLKDQRDE